MVLVNENFNWQVVSQNRHIKISNLLFLNVMPITHSDDKHDCKQAGRHPLMVCDG